MNNLEYDGSWEEVKERLKDKYPVLVDNDFEDENNDDKMLAHLQQKLGKTNDEMREIIRTI